ncbi:hypothetical protein, partial [Pseudomonas avellanae]
MSVIVPKPPLPVLPSLPATVLPALASLTSALSIPRDVLASDEEIEYAWNDLPRELRDIPSPLRGELVAKMCVAVSAGLFDSAMNYIWNAAILHLRQKIRNFGLPVVATILEADFEEKHLMDRQDSQLLELALKLNLVAEDGFFFLDQCRSVRNSFSAAHPTMGAVNDREFTTFLNRCVRYALADSSSPKGVDLKAFLSAVKGGRFTDNQKIVWNQRLLDTHDAQRQMLTLMVYGIYCDPNASEFSRQNSIDICISLKESFTSSTRSELVSKHSEYAAKGDDPRHAASLQFFERLGALQLLDNAEQHAIFTKALERLWTAHLGSNNFYSEPPFAERVLELSRQSAVPETAQETFVNNVVCCMLGNGYGVCWAAAVYYEQIIRAFSPREIALMIRLAHTAGNPISNRLHSHS